MKLGLENITRLLEHLGEPQRKFPALLVGGTNGKGSVTAFASSILRSAGLSVGSFYSPHLFRVNERIRLNGDEIPSPVLDEIIGELRVWYERAPFTFFECLTAAAVLYFVRAGVDIAVFEVGLGGRLDATRIVNAIATVVTGISRDHSEHLGATHQRILREKLGIVRRGVPLVANLKRKALLRYASRYCRKEEVPLHSVRDEVVAEMTRLEPDGMTVELETPLTKYGAMETRMIGMQQVGNIATAVLAVEVLAACASPGEPMSAVERETAARPTGSVGNYGVPGALRAGRLPPEAVRDGIRSAFLPGRFQVLPGKPRIIVDVSHNEDALLASLNTLLEMSPRERNVLVFGVMANKELGTFPRRALRAGREVILTPLGSERGAPIESLLECFTGAAGDRSAGRGSMEVRGAGEMGRGSIRAVRGVGEAVRTARRILRPDDTLLILGSHITVEEAAAYL
jgi:dihydrofolate synthase/folylpolyglutamate synthase